MPESPMSAREAQPPAQQQLLEAVPAVRTQLDYDMVALFGIQRHLDLFGDMRGISDARAAQFGAFSRGEVGSISGTGLGEGNLRRLQERAAEALSYGIEIDVDIENRRFEITNNNYAPIGAMAPEEHAALVAAVEAAQGYLETAEDFRSQGRGEEAAAYVAMALQVQEVYSLYIEGLMGREAAQAGQSHMENAPRAGGSERVARDLVEMATGERVSGERLAEEFERATGVSYDDFIVREVDGEYAGTGIAGVAAHGYSESVAYVDAGIGALNAALQMIYDGESIAGMQEYQQQVSFAAQNFGYAGGLMDAADSMMRNVYHMMAARDGAERMDSLDVGGMLTVTREVRPSAAEIERLRAHPEVRVQETERVMIEGADRHLNSLDAERLSVRREYAAAESGSREAALCRMIMPQTQEAAVEYVERSERAEAGAERHFSEADSGSAHLRGRVASILTYEPVWQAIQSDQYATPLRLADPSGELVAERDRIAGQLDEAMREGTSVEGLDVQLRSLDYRRSAASWERYQFPEITGERARAGLDRIRNGLVRDLRRAASSGAELEGLEERKATLIAAEEECLNFEQAVMNAAGRAYAAADSLRNGIDENNGRVSGVLEGIPDEVTYRREGGGDTAASDVRVDLRDNKRIIAYWLGELGGYSERLAELEREVEGWMDTTLSSYEPSLVVQSGGTFDLEGRYGMDNSRYFAELRDIDLEVRDIGGRVSASVAILGDATRDMVGEYRGGLEDARQAAMAASGIDLADPFSWAMGGALFRGGQLAWRGVQAAWTGITAKAAQEGALAFAARATELTARAVPTVGTVAQNTYAAYSIATAENFDEVMEGAMWIGALGSTGGLVGLAGRGARYLSIAVDTIAVTAMVAGIGYQTYQAFDRGGEEWWDLARVGAMGALGAAGAGMGLTGSLRMRVPGGFRDVLPSGLISGRVIPPAEVGQAAQAGGRAFGEAAGEVPLRPMTPMEREQAQAMRRVAEDSAAIRNLEREFISYQGNPAAYLGSIPGGAERGLPEEIAALARIRREHPDWTPGQLAVSYVESLRAQGAAMPPHLLRGMVEPAAAQMGRAATELAPAAGREAVGRAATELAPAARARTQVPRTMIEQPAPEVARASTELAPGLRITAEDEEAARMLADRYTDVRQQIVSGRRAIETPPETAEMMGEMRRMDLLHPEWGGDPQRLATEYVKFLRMNELPLPSAVTRRVSEAPAAFMPTQAVESPLAGAASRPPAAAAVREARTAVAPAATEDALAAERLLQRERQVSAASAQGGAVIIPAEVMRMRNIARERGIGIEEAALAYVQENRGRLPGWMLGVEPQGRPVVFPTVLEAATPEAAQAARARGEVVLGAPLTEIEYRGQLGMLGRQERLFVDNRFHNDMPDEATMGNALAVFGDRRGPREGIAGDFREAMLGGRVYGDEVRVTAYVDENGRIVGFGNNVPPQVRESAEMVSIRVNFGSGRITQAVSVEAGREAPATVSSLVGMQVTPAAAGQRVSGVPRVSPVPSQIVERYSRTFNMREIEDMWENLQNGLYVIPGAGTESQATRLYEDFIRMSARHSSTGEVGGILIRGDMSGVNVGNAMLGTGVMDMTIAARMEGVRQTVMETAERLGLEGVTPVFTRRPGRSDEFMIAIFGPGDSVTAHADEFISALREAPAGRIAELAGTQQYAGRSITEIAEGGLRHPESVTKFKFDYADFSVNPLTPPGFLDEAAGRAANAGSAAHTPVVAESLGLDRTSLLFVPNRTIRQMEPEEMVQGSVFDISFRMPPSVQREVERDLGEFLLPRLDGMVQRQLITRAESEAIARSISAHGGSLPIDDAARYLFRKGAGQALSGEMRVKLLNALVGEERFNPFASTVDGAVAWYAREHGIVVERASGSPTMQYVIRGVGGDEAAAHRRGIEEAIYDAISQREPGLIPSVRMFNAPEGMTAANIDLFLGAQRCGGASTGAAAAGDYVVTAFGSGRDEYVDYIFSLVPPQSRAAMEEVLDTVSGGRGITKLNDLYEVLQRTDPALYENFIRMMERPEMVEGLMRIMPQEAAENLRYLSGMPF